MSLTTLHFWLNFKQTKKLCGGEYFLPGVLTFPAPLESLTLEKNYIGLGIDLVRLFAIQTQTDTLYEDRYILLF